MKQIIIITGASSGMGSEFAREIAKNADKTKSLIELWLISRNEAALKEIASQVMSKIVSVKIFPFDISGKEGVSHFSSILHNEKNQVGAFSVQMLVNNAGFGTYGPFNNTPLSKELEMIDLNCTALTGFCGLIIPYLSKGSKIINVASLAAFLPLGNFAVYAATKAYVLSFSLALSAELKDKGINVCALCPGPVLTNFANIASNGSRKIVKHGKSPQKVVAHCLRRSNAGAPIAIMALKWKFKAAASRFIGKYIGARFTYLYCKRPNQISEVSRESDSSV